MSGPRSWLDVSTSRVLYKAWLLLGFGLVWLIIVQAVQENCTELSLPVKTMTVFFFVAPTIGILLLFRLVYILTQVRNILGMVYEIMDQDEIDHDDIMLDDYSEGEE